MAGFDLRQPERLAGMQVFHHKTAKESFQRRFWLVVIIQVIVVVLIYWLVR